MSTHIPLKHLAGRTLANTTSATIAFASGATPKVAEWLATEQAQLLEKNLATKANIANIQRNIEDLRAATQKDIEGLRKDTMVEITKLETTLTKAIADLQFKIILSLAAFGTILVALSKFL